MRNVLFLCTGNSARSILAEALINHPEIGRGEYRGYSAGSRPRGFVDPFALEWLEQSKVSTTGLRSKSWNEFAGPNAPPIHYIFTVCDHAAGETCPIWPGHPVTAHWSVPDPAVVNESDEARRHAFHDAARVLRHRIELFAALPLDILSGTTLERRLDDIGRSHP